MTMGANFEYFICSRCGTGITCDEYAAMEYKRKEKLKQEILCDKCERKEYERDAY